MQRFLLFFCLIIGALPSFAENLTLTAQDETSVTLKLNLPAFSVETLTAEDGKTYQRLHAPQWAKTHQIGYPEIPYLTKLVQVPPDGEVSVKILHHQTASVPLAQLYPVAKPVASAHGVIEEAFTRDSAIYQSQQFYPQQLVVLENRAYLRGVPVMRVKVYPLQWHPQQGVLRYATDLKIQLQFSEPLPPKSEETEHPRYKRLLRSHIANYAHRSANLRNSPPPQASPQRHSVSFQVPEAGIYRLTHETLKTAGIPENCLSQGNFLLHAQGQPIMPQIVVQQPGWFLPGDYLEFYGDSFETPFSRVNVYQLDCWQLAPPRPAPTVNNDKPLKLGALIDSNQQNATASQTTFTETVRFEDNRTYWVETPGAPQQDFWFWSSFFAPSEKDYEFELSHPLINQPATLKIATQGSSTAEPHPNHHTQVFINDVLVADYKWDNDVAYLETVTIPPNTLKAGTNIFRINMPGDTGTKIDVTYLNWFEITYQRQLIADKDQLQFTVQGEGPTTVQINQLTRENIRVYDISNPQHIKEVVNFTVSGEDENYQLQFTDRLQGEKTYFVSTERKIRKIEEPSLVQPNTLRLPNNQADFILITRKAFLPAVQPLVEHRRARGLSVKAVALEDIYHEFNFGIESPYAIKDFLKYAYFYWQTPRPQYVLLVGDATFDYKDELHGQRKLNIVPTYMTKTLYGLTPDDNWFVSVDGEDELADMMIGRLPGGSPEEVTPVIEKIMSYENNAIPSQQVLLVADRESQFERVSDLMVEFAEKRNLTNDKIYLLSYDKEEASEKARSDIIQGISNGALITQYIGHGHIEIWGKLRFFRNEDVEKLTNRNKYTLVLALNCLNAYFTEARDRSLGETFVITPEKGAFAMFSSSGLGYLWEYELLNQEIYNNLFIEDIRVLGEFFTKAKIAAFGYGANRDTLSNLVLLGDPASTLHLPQ